MVRVLLRAEFAMSTRRLEMNIEQIKTKSADQLAELRQKGRRDQAPRPASECDLPWGPERFCQIEFLANGAKVACAKLYDRDADHGS
jgi:hypothetical protein